MPSRSALCALVLTLLFACRCADAADRFPWLRTPLSAFPGTDRFNAVPILSDATVAFLANHYDVVSFGGGITNPTNATCGEDRIADVGRRLLAANASVRPMFYLNDIINYLDVCAAKEFERRPDLWLRKPDGAPALMRGLHLRDVSLPAVHAWYAATLSNASVLPYIRGAYCDKAVVVASTWTKDAGAAKAAEMVVGQRAQLDAVRAALGSSRLVVFNGMRAPEGLAALDLLPHADGGEMEHWLSLEQRLPNGSLNLRLVAEAITLITAAAALDPPKAVILRALPGPCVGGGTGGKTGTGIQCRWPNNSTPTTPAALQAAATAFLPFNLAAFLLFAGPSFLMDWGWGYRVEDYVPCAVLGVGPCYVPDEWWPPLLKAPGTPMGPATNATSPWLFTRTWTGVNVTVDFIAETAVLEWADGSVDATPPRAPPQSGQ